MKKQMTQKRAVFYMLYKAHKENPEEYIPAWKFVGELFVPEINEWFFMSYKCPANGVMIHFDNPNLIERRFVTGKTGAKYFEYRIRQGVTTSDIVEPSLISFRKMLQQ